MNIDLPFEFPEDCKALNLTYQWSDYDPYLLVGEADYQLMSRLSRITNWGKLVYSIACAEWLLFRLSDHVQSVDARLYLDACWAYQMSDGVALPEELPGEQWQGKVLGPLCLMLTTIINTRYGFDENNAESDAAFANRQVNYFNLETDFFKEWELEFFERLSKSHSIGSDNKKLRVPFRYLDLATPLTTINLEAEIDKDLKAILNRDNPYIELIS